MKFNQLQIENINNTKAVNDNDEDEDASTLVLSNAQALSAVNDLSHYVVYLSQSEDALQKLNYVEKSYCLTANSIKPFCQTKICN